jgi:hypothetical protein
MSKWEEWKKAQGETRPWHILDSNKYIEDENLGKKRLEICKTCPELIKLTTQCKKCGCFMAAKTKIQAASCPIGKWGAEQKTIEELSDDTSSKIFINIPSYKDPEIWLTVENFINNAKHPERIFFAITLQSIDQKDDRLKASFYNNVKADIIEPGSLIGCQPARKNSHKFYNNEDYYLNMDSHMRSIKNWDVEIIREYEKNKVEHGVSVFTAYAPPYDLLEDGTDLIDSNITSNPTFYMSESNTENFYKNLVPQFTSQYTGSGKNVFSPYVSGHFFFTEKQVIEKVPFMSEITFTEEEPLMALRFFTAGFNLITPSKVFVYHRYGRGGRSLFWEDFPEKFFPEDQKSRDYFKELVKNNRIDPENGLFAERSLEDYEKYSGISFSSGTLHDGVKSGLPSGSF